MEIVEVVVYLSVALIVGALIFFTLSKLTNTDAKDLLPGDNPEIRFKVDNVTVAATLFQVWDECNMGKKEGVATFQMESPREVSIDHIFQEIKNVNLCSTLASVSRDCGSREDIDRTDPIQPGRVYTARCDTVNKKLVIEGP